MQEIANSFIIENMNLSFTLGMLQRKIQSTPSLPGTLGKKATIHQITTMLPTSINVLFPGHDILQTTGTHDLIF